MGKTFARFPTLFPTTVFCVSYFLTIFSLVFSSSLSWSSAEFSFSSAASLAPSSALKWPFVTKAFVSGFSWTSDSCSNVAREHPHQLWPLRPTLRPLMQWLKASFFCYRLFASMTAKQSWGNTSAEKENLPLKATGSWLELITRIQTSLSYQPQIVRHILVRDWLHYTLSIFFAFPEHV